MIRPLFLVRVGYLYSSRIGHFAGNTELYLCELDAGINKPNVKFIDLFFVNEAVSNNHLMKMWKRELIFLPKLILYPIHFLTRVIPQGYLHRTGIPSQHDRDIHNLFDQYPPHLMFTAEEEDQGRSKLLEMGIHPDEKFVCLNVRDSAFLSSPRYIYHSYRDCTIDNYLYTAEKLAESGFKVIRMGAKVNNQFVSDNFGVIDYATNGMRSEFMDIFLGAKCYFTLTTGSGWDCIPYIFRRPMVYAPLMPFGLFSTYSPKFIGIFKHHFLIAKNRELTLDEIFSTGLAYAQYTEEFDVAGIKLVEPTKEEIWEVTNEMTQLIENNFKTDKQDIPYREKIVEYFDRYPKKGVNGKPLHGEIMARIGINFLKRNIELLN